MDPMDFVILRLQEIYQTLHPLVFSNITVAVVVYSLLTEICIADFHQYINNIVSRVSIPILLVGTHLDKVGGDYTLPLLALKTSFPQVKL